MELWQVVKMILERTTSAEDPSTWLWSRKKPLEQTKQLKGGAVDSLLQQKSPEQVVHAAVEAVHLTLPFNQQFLMVTKLHVCFSKCSLAGIWLQALHWWVPQALCDLAPPHLLAYLQSKIKLIKIIYIWALGSLIIFNAPCQTQQVLNTQIHSGVLHTKLQFALFILFLEKEQAAISLNCSLVVMKQVWRTQSYQRFDLCYPW